MMKKLIAIALTTGLLMGTVAFGALAHGGNDGLQEDQLLKQKHTHVVQKQSVRYDSRQSANRSGSDAKPAVKPSAHSERKLNNRPQAHYKSKKPVHRIKTQKHTRHFEENR